MTEKQHDPQPATTVANPTRPGGLRWYLIPTVIFSLLCLFGVFCGLANTIGNGLLLFKPSANRLLDWRFADYIGQIAVGIAWGIAALQWWKRRIILAAAISALSLLAAIPLTFVT